VDKVNFNGTATLNDGSAMETELDAEFSGMVAPAAQIHVFTSADNSDAGEEAMFTAILDDNRAQVVNYSWGSCEQGVDPGHRTAMQNIFARAVAQGVNIMVASGDSGSSCDGSGNTIAGFQPSMPYVVAVGGTTLPSGLSGPETGWSGSGGGISTVYATPSWQKGIGAAFTMRSYPDVAYNADPSSGQPLWAHANGVGSAASYIVVGGTSIAAPQWSGFLALVGQARGGKALGYLNPILYGLSSDAQAGVLSDVTSGSNGAYKAGPGFDAVTGLGSMKGPALLTLLKNQ
jgi:kumamolisin